MMTDLPRELRARFEELGNEELAEVLTSDEYTGEAKAVARDVMTARPDAHVPAPAEKETAQEESADSEGGARSPARAGGTHLRGIFAAAFSLGGVLLGVTYLGDASVPILSPSGAHYEWFEHLLLVAMTGALILMGAWSWTRWPGLKAGVSVALLASTGGLMAALEERDALTGLALLLLILIPLGLVAWHALPWRSRQR